jgi:hypothetical protein
MKRRMCPADRLIRIIVRRRGAATLREITRAHLTGADFEEAKRETACLVVFEPTYQNGRRKRSLTARLTQQGVWQAIRLTRGYDPALAVSALAATDIKALLDRLEAERNPLAVEIAGFRADAMEYRRQLAARKTAKNEYEKALLVAPKRKRSARHYERLAKFLESKKQPAFGLRVPEVSAKACETSEATAPINPKPTFKQPTQTPQEEYLAMLAQQNRIVAEAAGFRRQSYVPKDCLPAEPSTTTTGESRIDIIRRANIAGFPTRGGREIMLNSEWVSCEKWAAANPK